MDRIRYYLDSTWRSLRANAVLNSLTVLGAGLAFFILFLVLLLYTNFRAVAEEVSSSGVVTVFAEDNADAATLENIRKRMEDTGFFSNITYVSPEAAREKFLSMYPDMSGVLDALGYNPFPPSFTAKLKSHDVSSVSAAVSAVKGFPGVSSVEGAGLAGGRGGYLVRSAELLGLLVLVVLSLSVAFLIGNTIRLNVFSKKDEIDILRLVGATPWFIRIPFLIEGVVQSLGAAAAAMAALFLFYSMFLAELGSRVFASAGAFSFFSAAETGVLFLCAGLLGLISSFTAVTGFMDKR